MARKYWLMKSEPDVYSIDQLESDGTTCWEGVRNYQARNFMRDDLKLGDGVLFYHSRSDKAIVGIAKVSREGYPDHFQFDKKHKYFDAKAKKEDPRWIMVDVEFVAKLDKPLELAELKEDPALEGMPLLARGQRLSVQPVDEKHFKHVLKLAKIPFKTLG